LLGYLSEARRWYVLGQSALKVHEEELAPNASVNDLHEYVSDFDAVLVSTSRLLRISRRRYVDEIRKERGLAPLTQSHDDANPDDEKREDASDAEKKIESKENVQDDDSEDPSCPTALTTRHSSHPPQQPHPQHLVIDIRPPETPVTSADDIIVDRTKKNPSLYSKMIPPSAPNRRVGAQAQPQASHSADSSEKAIFAIPTVPQSSRNRKSTGGGVHESPQSAKRNYQDYASIYSSGQNPSYQSLDISPNSTNADLRRSVSVDKFQIDRNDPNKVSNTIYMTYVFIKVHLICCIDIYTHCSVSNMLFTSLLYSTLLFHL
jgi:hypothetical protein